MRRATLLALAGFSLAVLTSGCMSVGVELEPISFEYPSSGVGGQPVLADIALVQGQEQKQISRVLVDVLTHEFELGIEAPTLALGEPLPEGETIVTQYLGVPTTTIEEHNRSYPELALAPGFLYQLAYQIKYRLEDRELLFQVTPLLQRRAGGGAWRDASRRDYSSVFFVEPLEAALRQKLRNELGRNTAANLSGGGAIL
jgi:hypothetical protein